MARSARPLEEVEPWSFGDFAAALLGLIIRNPVLVGGSTAFLVALSFVSANALWYQPHGHSGAFFATRDLLRPDAPVQVEETTILIERPDPDDTRETPTQVEGDPTLKSVQETLKQLKFYGGEVDGLYGPNTRLAIEAYQKKMGLTVTGTVDETLLDLLGTASVASVVLPSPAPRETTATDSTSSIPVTTNPTTATAHDERIAKVQAGLREFGNDAIEVDGLLGAKTKAAIREFQSLFGLAETGEADASVLAKMREIGLIQ